MRQALLVNGQQLRVGSGHKTPIMRAGKQDDFPAGDGAITSDWTDASVQYPTMFNPVTIKNHRAEALPITLSTYGAGPFNTMVGHHLLYRDIGVSDNFEVGCTWVIDDPERIIGQVGPAIFVDPNSSDPLEMGISPIFDISGPSTYIQNVFREAPISDVFNPAAYYQNLGGGSNKAVVVSSGAGLNKVAIRVVSGVMRYYWNGRQIGAAVSVPSHYVGRTKAGIHVISAKIKVGQTGIGGGTISTVIPDVIDNWYWRPL